MTHEQFQRERKALAKEWNKYDEIRKKITTVDNCLAKDNVMEYIEDKMGEIESEMEDLMEAMRT